MCVHCVLNARPFFDRRIFRQASQSDAGGAGLLAELRVFDSSASKAPKRSFVARGAWPGGTSREWTAFLWGEVPFGKESGRKLGEVPLGKESGRKLGEVFLGKESGRKLGRFPW